MTSKEAIKELRQYNSVGLCGDKTLFEPIEKDLEILEILKSKIMLIENKQMTFGYGKYYLAIRPDVILSDDTIKMIKEWLDGN